MLRGICAGVATPCCATTTWIFGSALLSICLMGRLRRLVIPASLMGLTPSKGIHEQAAFLVEFLLSRQALFLCLSLLFFCHRLGLLQLLNRERGVEFFRVIIQIKQPRSAIGANDEGHHGMAIGVFIVRCFGEAE